LIDPERLRSKRFEWSRLDELLREAKDEDEVLVLAAAFWRV
jgi:hypothetical protein